MLKQHSGQLAAKLEHLLGGGFAAKPSAPLLGHTCRCTGVAYTCLLPSSYIIEPYAAYCRLLLPRMWCFYMPVPTTQLGWTPHPSNGRRLALS